jgi:spore coat polysaccharide biosynthesis protein SpsF
VSVVVVVQARMGSTRLPGKVLQELDGRPLLQFQLERLGQGLPSDWSLVVATTTADRDTPVADLAASLGVEVVRGEERDVLARFAQALDRFPASTVVRLTADCPLSDPAIVREVVDLHHSSSAVYTSNVYPRSYPKGLDVEAVSADALRAAATEAVERDEREHVTPFVVRRPRRFPMATLYSGDDLGEQRWTVDYPEDLDRLRAMVARLADATAAGWREILAAVELDEPPPGSVHLRPLPPPAPGSAPWTRTWAAERAGQRVGTASVSVDDDRETAIVVDAPDEAVLVQRALDELLASDVQVTRRDPS